MKKSSKLAFSLIELSVVILIIGILVLGVTQGSRMMRSTKLVSARSLTASSPVNAFNDIALWLDTTSEKSFDTAEASDQSSVSNWYDIKQSAATDAFNVRQSDSAKRPKYIANATNGLPALRFDGTDDFMQKTNVSSIDLSDGGNQISIFIVQKYYSPAHQSSALSIVGTNRVSIHSTWSDGTFYFDFADISNGGRMTHTPNSTELSKYFNKASILTFVRRISSADNGLIRINGVEKPRATLTGNLDISNQIFYISASTGSSNYQKGDINEIIVIKSGLTDTEIASVEQYLSTKWGVPLTGI